MQSDDLTPEQAEIIKRRIMPMLGYVNRLKDRMNKRNFRRDDPLFDEVLNAADALHRLSVTIHYLSCKSGVGRERR